MDTAKAKRPDVAAKKKLRKENDEVVVKASLRKYVVGDAKTKNKIVEAIVKRVEGFSRRIVLGSRVVSSLVKEAFDGKDDLTSVKIPNIFDATFVRQAMLGTESALKVYDIVQEFHEKNPKLLHGGPRSQGDSNLYVFGAKKYITNVKNSLKTNFTPRLKRYLKFLEDAGVLSQPEKVFTL
jgi:hypothetical protein